MNYFTNKERNKKHASRLMNIIRDKYSQQAKEAAEGTSILDYRDIHLDLQAGDKETIIEFMKATTVEAIFCNRSEKVAVLNFASYKNPGGMFLEGSYAQEESLCHSSVLYPALQSKLVEFYEYNRYHLDKALYQDRLLYSKDVLFFLENSNCETKVDVITAAAPNWGVYSKYNGDTATTRKRNKRVLYNRFKAILHSAIANNCTTLVLGAWGCGVFKQDATIVAGVMKAVLDKCDGCLKRVIFAIPDDSHYKAFYDVFTVKTDL